MRLIPTFQGILINRIVGFDEMKAQDISNKSKFFTLKDTQFGVDSGQEM